MTANTPQPRVISYTRFSSKRQAKGDSYRRQTALAQEWCAKNGYELDPLSYEDLGVSGFSGANKTKGALGALLRAAESGEIEAGSILLVEALDRLTREDLSESVPLLMSIVNAGLTIVTLVDGKVWDKAALTDMANFMLSVVLLFRGHEEVSRRKKMVQRAFRQARKTRSKEPFSSAPGWLYRESKDQPWQVNEELADVVRRVFDYAIKGYGSKAIAKIANEQAWPVPMRLNQTEGRWHPQMPGIILRNRAVLGEHEHYITDQESLQKHWKGVSSGIVDKNYYPRIVSDETFYRARAAIEARAADKRRDTHYFNIFSGLMFCGHCGAPIHRKSELSSGRKASIVCSHKLSGASKEQCATMSAPNADIPILLAIWDYARMTGSGLDKPKDQAELVALEAKLNDLSAAAARVVNAIADGLGSSGALRNKLQELEEEIAETSEKLEEKRLELAAADGSIFDEDYSDLQTYIENLYVPHDDAARDLRAELHVKLAQLVEHVFVWGYDAALVKFKNEDAYLPVELQEKRLPSRANPAAKYHKPPKPRPPQPKPFYKKALAGRLIPPEPKLTVNMRARKKTHYRIIDEDDELSV